MSAVRCWLFGHDWLHLDTHFIDGDRLTSSHLCDRCEAERSIVLSVNYFDDGGESDEVDLEAALDGLQDAVRYCDDRSFEELSSGASRLYQDLGAKAPEEDWEVADA